MTVTVDEKCLSRESEGACRSPAKTPLEILAEGRNCWRIAEAARAALVTNADYFRLLAQSLKRARRKIMLIGWHLDASLRLDPRSEGPEGRPLKEFLAALLDERPDLDIRFLLWDRTIFYGGNRLSASALAELGARYPGFRHHFAPAPFVSSHHAKLVVIDDGLAFIGGIDLAGDRWDPADHPISQPERITPTGEIYGPIHDLQMLVTGPAAKALADHAALRWTAATGESPPRVESPCSAWPMDLEADFVAMPAGIARTEPENPHGPVREVEALNHDALASARHSIYLEAQYLTAEAIGDSLIRRLEEANGPEIVIVVTQTSHGYLEQFAMGNNRDRLLRRLRAADRWRRLRVYYPTACDGTNRAEVKVHSKLMVIDDRLIRVGSSNLNNRSMAVDTECDLVFEAANPTHRERIRAIRDRLIAGQLHLPADVVTATLRRNPSLIAAMTSLNAAGYLQPLEAPRDEGPSEPIPGTALLDPSEPLTLGRLWSEIGLGGMNPLAEFGSGQQQTAEDEGD